MTLCALIDREKGVATDFSKFHMILCGNPGSWKTMAARIIAQIFKDIGILKNNTFIECKRSDLVGRYIGATAIQTRAVAKRAIGGFVFLDEAYTLAPKTRESNDYGREAADELLVWMNSNVDSTIQNPIFIFAGYEKPMIKDFMALNPRFPRRLKNVLIFQDFKAQELASITKEGLNFKYPHDVDGMLLKCFSSLCSSIVSKNNGSLCADLIDCFQSVQEERIGWTFAGHGDLFKITKQDMEMGIKRFLREKLTRYGRNTKTWGQ
uniref:AAA+ ATPase domain-containing protein n=1 Tax=Clytia hemisphaerica TaxID=252671 RepID=A0A7M6DR02_9CNID